MHCIVVESLADDWQVSADTLRALAQTPQWRALLHFKGEKSLIGKDSGFFLHENGHKDPLSELKATLEAMSDKEAKDGDKSAICRYRARAIFLARYFPHIAESLSNATCESFDEFRRIVIIERVAIAFAGESEIYPGSAMGHTFLVLEGEAKADFYKEIASKTTDDGAEIRNAIDIKQGQTQRYAVSFFATTELGLNPIAYIRALIGNLDGIYSLSPLENVEFDYLKNEQRSIWTLELQMSEAQKAMLGAHLWEIRDVPIDYSFITHNCNDALKFLLRAVDESFYTPQSKPYETPIEYLKSLQKAGKITHISIQTPESKNDFIAQYGANEILQTRDSAKVALSYVYSDGANLVSLYAAPIYSSIKNATNAYKEHIESRLLSIETRYNPRTKRAFVHKIEALHLFSMPDFGRTGRLVKYIDISFENPLQEHSRTHLKPHISFGVGLGGYVGSVSAYILPLLGYEYVRKHNAFVDIRAGIIASFPKVRVIGEYDYYVNFISNQKGYKHKASAFVGVNLYKQLDIFAQITYTHPRYAALQCGVSVNF